MAAKILSIAPIGQVVSDRAAATDDDWDRVAARIELNPARFTSEALQGLDTFSHVEVVFLFHQVPDDGIETGARHPRGRPDWPRVGIFAQRGKNRPNRIGLTTCRVLGVEGLTVHIEGLDAIDATPVLDLKPVMSGFAPRGPRREPDWATELMRDYWQKD